MKYYFRNYSGALLINFITTFLKKNGIIRFPALNYSEEKELFHSEDGSLIISFTLVKDHYGFFTVKEIINGFLDTTKTDWFHYC